MSIFKKIKQAWRARSIAYVKARYASWDNRHDNLCEYTYNGRTVYFRPGTSDANLIWDILIQKGNKAEYRVPSSLNVKTIFDIGSNIGISALFFAKKYPDATIYCFEPLSENFAILSKNIEGYPNIKAFQIGLSKEDGEFPVYSSDQSSNLGGASLFDFSDNGLPDNVNQSRTLGTPEREMIQVRAADKFFEEQGIDSVDIIKIDTEGAEYDILSSLPRTLIENCAWITGELHGIKNYETLAIIDKTHGINANKPHFGTLFPFEALNKKLLGKVYLEKR